MRAIVIHGYFAGKECTVLRRSITGDGWAVKFDNNPFVFIFAKDNLLIKED